MPKDDFGKTLAEVRRWADEHPCLAEVYVYSSRVRGDHRPDSGLDIALLYDSTNYEAMSRWFAFHDEGTVRELERRLGIKLHICEAHKDFRPTRNEPDVVLPLLKANRDQAVHVRGKVRCVLLPKAEAFGH